MPVAPLGMDRLDVFMGRVHVNTHVGGCPIKIRDLPGCPIRPDLAATTVVTPLETHGFNIWGVVRRGRLNWGEFGADQPVKMHLTERAYWREIGVLFWVQKQQKFRPKICIPNLYPSARKMSTFRPN